MKRLTEEKAIIDYIENGHAVSIDNVEAEKRRYTDIARTLISKKKSHQHQVVGKRY